MQVRAFARQLGKAMWDDDLPDVAAMLAYYAVMSLFPMLVFIGSIALAVVPESTVHQGVAMAGAALPPAVREIVDARLDMLLTANHAGFAIGGALLALWGASRGATGLMTALGAIHSKPETRSWVRRQLTAVIVTIGVGVVVVIALGVLVAGPTIGHLIADRFGLGAQFDLGWTIARWVGAGLLVMFVWAIVYKFLPDTDAPFRVFTPGACIGVLIWLGASALFGLYLEHFNSYETTYGALGGAIIFLLWLWITDIALLVGAEINDVLADARAHKSAAAAQLADPHEQAHAHP